MQIHLKQQILEDLCIGNILFHEIPVGSIIGPNKGFGGWGYPEKNRIGHCVKEGAEELIRFTNMEIEKAKACYLQRSDDGNS